MIDLGAFGVEENKKESCLSMTFSSQDVHMAFASASMNTKRQDHVTRKEIFYRFKQILADLSISHRDQDIRLAKQALAL